MTHEQQIQTTCAQVFNTDRENVRLVERLMGGMSNYTYIVEVDNKKYTYRITGKNADNFVDRDVEAYHLKFIEPLALNNKTVYFDQESGVKIAEYVEGVPLHEKDPYDYLDEAAEVLRNIHKNSERSKYDYEPFQRLDKYESYLRELGHSHEKRYTEYKRKLLSHKDFLAKGDLTLVHGDAQISNFIATEKGLRLTDWEFTGNADPFHDIACFGNNNFDHAIALLPIYLRRTPTGDDYKRLYLRRVFQCLQWHNVALFKDKIGLSEDLNIDFGYVGGLYLDKAEALLSKLK